MSYKIKILSVNFNGQSGEVFFKPDTSDKLISLGQKTIPFEFDPTTLTPPRDVYGVYTIVFGEKCSNLVHVVRPTPTPTPTPTNTPTNTPTKTPTPTPTLTQSPNPCKYPTPTPTPTNTPTNTSTKTPTPTPTLTQTVNPCNLT